MADIRRIITAADVRAAASLLDHASRDDTLRLTLWSSATKVEVGDLTARDLQLCAGVVGAGMNPVAAFA